MGLAPALQAAEAACTAARLRSKLENLARGAPASKACLPWGVAVRGKRELGRSGWLCPGWSCWKSPCSLPLLSVPKFDGVYLPAFGFQWSLPPSGAVCRWFFRPHVLVQVWGCSHGALGADVLRRDAEVGICWEERQNTWMGCAGFWGGLCRCVGLCGVCWQQGLVPCVPCGVSDVLPGDSSTAGCSLWRICWGGCCWSRADDVLSCSDITGILKWGSEEDAEGRHNLPSMCHWCEHSGTAALHQVPALSCQQHWG